MLEVRYNHVFLKACFNINIVECKVIILGCPTHFLLRFNINIVECKEICVIRCIFSAISFNINIVECKDFA